MAITDPYSANQQKQAKQEALQSQLASTYGLQDIPFSEQGMALSKQALQLADSFMRQVGQSKQGGGNVTREEVLAYALQNINYDPLMRSDGSFTSPNAQKDYQLMKNALPSLVQQMFSTDPQVKKDLAVKAANAVANIVPSDQKSSSVIGKQPETENFTAAYGKARLQNPNLTVDQFRATNGSNPSTYGGITSNGAPASSQPPPIESSTFLSARKAGFTGNFNEWVNQGRPIGKGTAPTSTAPTDTTQVDKAKQDAENLKKAHDIINNNPALDQGSKDLFNAAVDSWDPTQQVNAPAILEAFNKIKNSTTDPYYKEKADIFTKQIQSQLSDIQSNRALETQAEALKYGNNGEDVRQAQLGLEQRGLTFSGEGVRQLGQQSAYANQPGGIVPFGGAKEGLVGQQGKLMSSSSALRYQQNLNQLGQQAEQALGAQGAGLVAGYKPLGVTVGSQQEARIAEEKALFSNLAGQYQQNKEYSRPVNAGLPE